MHLALIISSLQTGGAERVLSGLANAWVSQGHDISLITFSPQHENPAYPLDPRIDLYQLNQLSMTDQPYYLRAIKILKRIYKIRRALKRVQPDIVISFVDIMNITTILATRFLGIPVIVTERTHPAYYHLPFFYKWLRRLIYPLADKMIAQTTSASGYFSNLSEEKKAVIPNMVKQPKIQKTEDDVTRPVISVVTLGRLTKSKGFHLLLRAFDKIRNFHPDLRLTIYGEGPERHLLEKHIEELELIEYVSLPGNVQDVESALYQADLFVFPSYFEGFPNALCEAMAVGLPVVASNCSGTIDIIRDGIDGRLFNVGDEFELERLIRELIQDPQERLRLSQGALSIVDRFSQDSILKKWDEIFLEVAPR